MSETIPQAKNRGSRRPWGQRAGAAATLLPAAVAAVWLALRLSGTTAVVGPVVVHWQVSLSREGLTELRLPPIGTVAAVTHRTPVTLSLLAERVQVRSAPELLAALEEHGATQRAMERDARGAVRWAAVRVLLFGLLAGLACGRLAAPRVPRRALATAVLTVALLGGLGAGTLATYDRRALRSLRFTGMLSEAPQAIDLVRRGMTNLDRLRGEIRNATTNLARFYRVLESRPSDAAGEQIRVLHVSDLHNNTAGLEFVRSLAEQYQVDLVVCTGDLTDYGTAAENTFVSRWGPRAAAASGKGAWQTLFVMGNHDSRVTLAAARRLPRALAPADGVVTTAAGLRFVGWADPASQRDGFGSVDDSERQLAEQEQRLRLALPRLQPPPDVLLVHNYRVAEALAGTAPVILYGHDHRLRIAERAGSVLVDAGTTGAAGVRYFTAANPPPYSAVLLTFRRRPRPRLLSADLISLREPDDSFTIDRFRPENEPGSIGLTPHGATRSVRAHPQPHAPSPGDRARVGHAKVTAVRPETSRRPS